MGDKWETSVNSAQRTQSGRQVWETSVGDKCKLMRSQTSRVGDTCGRQVGGKCKIMRPKTPEWETSVGDKCKLMQPKAPRVGDKCGRQVRDKWETSVKSCSPRHPE